MPDLDIHYVARLARLALTPAEAAELAPQLADVLAYVQKLNEVDVTGVEPTAHALPVTNVMRLDDPRPSLAHEAALRNAPVQAGGLFIVPKIVE